jgi:2-haloacid dehalogenase
MERVRDVIFDLGGVLVDWDPRHLFLGRMGEDETDVEHFLRHVCSPAWHSRVDAGLPFEAAANVLVDEYPEYAAWIGRYVADWQHMFQGTHAAGIAALEHCRQRGLKLHALTNYPGDQIAFLYGRFDFMQEFRTVVVSGLVGEIKPSSAIFEYMLQRVDGRPCLFVDDRIENVLGARRSGMKAIHFDLVDGPSKLAVALAEYV